MNDARCILLYARHLVCFAVVAGSARRVHSGI